DEDFKHWCKIREAQMRVHQTTANTGIAVILDRGEFNNIHPIDKEPVGERLALQAMYHVYGKISADEAYGAIYKSHEYTDGGMLLSFDHAGDGFDVKGEKIVGFEVAGKNKKYQPAEAEIRGDKIFVRSAEVAEPVYLRYNWTNYGEVTVYSKNGIPLAPFRTSRNDE
ncbi:MAG: sialate O-acetylesterase, partial [Oscillospiraceae bacterium]|nr:sialate O-acetylesterase [Oscillospiraceae bacterium]